MQTLTQACSWLIVRQLVAMERDVTRHATWTIVTMSPTNNNSIYTPCLKIISKKISGSHTPHLRETERGEGRGWEKRRGMERMEGRREGLRHGYWRDGRLWDPQMKQEPILNCSHENPWRKSPGSGLMCRCRLWHFTFFIISNSDDVF